MEIAREVIDFINKNNISVYDEETCKGVFRHIIVRCGIETDEVMCIFVLNKEGFDKEKELAHILLSKFRNIKTIVKNINTKNTNVILGNKNIVLYGSGYIRDRLGDYVFNISPSSFYQVNPIQTEKLYSLAIQGANLSKTDIVFDLYCGIGTIGIFASKFVNRVYGIEIVEEAIDAAKENAKVNNITNVDFIAGDTKEVLEELIGNMGIKPNVVFVDPPRKGLDMETISNLLSVKPEKIVYISCNPATLIRDLGRLEELYSINKITPVDLFPFTRTC